MNQVIVSCRRNESVANGKKKEPAGTQIASQHKSKAKDAKATPANAKEGKNKKYRGVYATQTGRWQVVIR